MPLRPDRPSMRRPRRRRAAAVLVAAALASAATGCIGQRSRNDDHVGPYSPRPDAREHTLACRPPACPDRPDGGAPWTT